MTHCDSLFLVALTSLPLDEVERSNKQHPPSCPSSELRNGNLGRWKQVMASLLLVDNDREYDSSMGFSQSSLRHLVTPVTSHPMGSRLSKAQGVEEQYTPCSCELPDPKRKMRERGWLCMLHADPNLIRSIIHSSREEGEEQGTSDPLYMGGNIRLGDTFPPIPLFLHYTRCIK